MGLEAEQLNPPLFLQVAAAYYSASAAAASLQPPLPSADYPSSPHNSDSSAFSRLRLSVSSSSSSSFLSDSATSATSSCSAVRHEDEQPPPSSQPASGLLAGEVLPESVSTDQSGLAFLEYSILNGDIVQIPEHIAGCRQVGGSGELSCSDAGDSGGFSTPPAAFLTASADEHSSDSSYHSCDGAAAESSDRPELLLLRRRLLPTEPLAPPPRLLPAAYQPQRYIHTDHHLIRAASVGGGGTSAATFTTLSLSSYLESHASYRRAIWNPVSTAPAAAPRRQVGGIPRGSTWFRDSVHPRIIKGIPRRGAPPAAGTTRRDDVTSAAPPAFLRSLPPPSPPPPGTQSGKSSVDLVLISKSGPIDVDAVSQRRNSLVGNTKKATLFASWANQQQHSPSPSSNVTDKTSPTSKEVRDSSRRSTSSTGAKGGGMTAAVRTVEAAFVSTRRSVSLPKTRPPPAAKAEVNVNKQEEEFDRRTNSSSCKSAQQLDRAVVARRFLASPVKIRNANQSTPPKQSPQPERISDGGGGNGRLPPPTVPPPDASATAHQKQQQHPVPIKSARILRSLSPSLVHRRRNSHSESPCKPSMVSFPAASKFSPATTGTESPAADSGGGVDARLQIVMQKDGLLSVTMTVDGSEGETAAPQKLVAHGRRIFNVDEDVSSGSCGCSRSTSSTSTDDQQQLVYGCTACSTLQYVLHSSTSTASPPSAWRRRWLKRNPKTSASQEAELQLVGTMDVVRRSSTSADERHATIDGVDDSEFVVYVDDACGGRAAAAAAAAEESIGGERGPTSRSLRFEFSPPPSSQANTIIKRSIFSSPLASPAAAANLLTRRRRRGRQQQQLSSPEPYHDEMSGRRICSDNYQQATSVTGHDDDQTSTDSITSEDDDDLETQEAALTPLSAAAASTHKELAAIVVHHAVADRSDLAAASSLSSGGAATDGWNGQMREGSTEGGGVTVLLPAGNHGLPKRRRRRRRRRPSSLIERWRTGGRCECGGWDLGCGIKVLRSGAADHSAAAAHSTAAAADHHDTEEWNIFSQGSKAERVLSLRFLRGDSYKLHFRRQLSSLVAFATAIAILHVRRFRVSTSLSSSSPSTPCGGAPYLLGDMEVGVIQLF